jgi:hypothetical protein
MSGHQPRQRAALGQDVPKRRPSLASPLPPTPFVPSTPLPRTNSSLAQHHHQPAFQQRPSTATSTSSSTLSDSPTTCSTRGMMKRLLAKPAPPSSPSAPFSLPSMKPFHHEDDHKTQSTQDQDPVQEITISSSQPNDALVTPRSANEFDKSIRALDLVGQIDISMAPCTTTSSDFLAEPSGSVKKQRNVFRRRPSGTAITTPSVPTSPFSGSPAFFCASSQFTYTFLLEYPFGSRFQAVEDSTSLSSSPTPTPSITTSITPRHPPFPRRSSLPPTRRLTPQNSSASNDSRPSQPKASHTRPNKVEQQSPVASYPVLGDKLGRYCDEKGERRSENGGTGSWSTLTLSGKWGRNDSNHLSRPKPSLHESSSVVDKNQGMVKKLTEVPAGDSPTRRLWKLVKKVSVSGLREKNQSDSDYPPPVPLLPSDISNDQHCTQSHSSLIVNGLKKAVSASTLASSRTKPFDNMYKTTLVPSTPPSTSAQRHTKSPSAPHSPPSQPPAGPRPSTTTRSSSPSSDVASSRFFNRQSARSSTSSLGEEAIPLPPLPKNSIPTATSTSMINANDSNGSRKLQHHIIPPSELSRNHSTTNINPIHPPPSMEEDWTIVRSPSVELEAFSLPPPPRQLLRGVGIGVGLDRPKTADDQRSKAKARASDVIPSMLKMSSEQVDEKSREISNNAGDEKNDIEESIKSEQGDKEKDILEPNIDRESNRSQSPTIPSFSISSAINSFPARRVSSSLSATSNGSPVALSPDRSNRSSGSVFSTAKVLRSSSRSPQRSGSRTAFGRVRQHLFGTNDVHVKTEETTESDEVNPLPSSLKSGIQITNPPQQQEHPKKAGKHHRYSSGGTTAKSKTTHAVSASSVSMPASPITSSPHRRSISFNTSPALPTQGFFTPSISSPNSLIHAPQASTTSTPHMIPLPLSPVAPSPTSSMDHRSRSSSNLRSGFSSRKLSEVLFSPSSISRPTSPGLNSTAPRTRPSSPSSHRTIGTFISRSLSVGPSNRSKFNTPNPVTPPQPRTQLTDQEKTDKWNDLLARSARAGGTLHLAAGSRVLGSDDIEHG